jgi:hypothetical protein
VLIARGQSRRAGGDEKTPTMGVGLTLRSQLALSSRLDGFRSRCRTSAEWSALSARRVYDSQAVVSERDAALSWYIKYWQWSSLSLWVRMTRWRSVSMSSCTR